MRLLDKPAGRFRLVVRRGDRDVTCNTLVFEHYKQAVAHVAQAVCDHTCEEDVPEAVLLQRSDTPAVTPQPDSASAAPQPDCASSERWLDIERWGSDVIRRIVQQRRATCRQAAALAAWAATERQQAGSRPPRGVTPACDRMMPSVPPPDSALPDMSTEMRSLPAQMAAPPRPGRPAFPRTAQTAESLQSLFKERLVRTLAVSQPAGNGGTTPRALHAAVSAVRPVPQQEPPHSARWGRRAYIAVTALMLALGWLAIVLWMTGGHPSELIRGMENAADASPTAEVHFDAPPRSGSAQDR